MKTHATLPVACQRIYEMDRIKVLLDCDYKILQEHELHVRRLSKVKPIIKSIGFSGPGGQWSASVLEIAENQVNKRKSYANANRVIISPSMKK